MKRNNTRTHIKKVTVSKDYRNQQKIDQNDSGGFDIHVRIAEKEAKRMTAWSAWGAVQGSLSGHQRNVPLTQTSTLYY